MPEIVIYSYVTARGTSIGDDWFDAATPKMQTELLARLAHLEQQPTTGWKDPHFHTLKGECVGLGAIRFKADKVQYRALGFWGPLRRAFTIVDFAYEKGGKYLPKNICRRARERKQEAIDDISRIRQFDPI